jgi:isocitrate/isopropylmalate dehydrogenase
MARYRVAVIPGDGVGDEVAAEANRVLVAAATPSTSCGVATGT